MATFPPTVAEFHTLNDDRKASQLVANNGRRAPILRCGKGIKVCDGARGADLETFIAYHEGIPAQRHQVDEAPKVRLLIGEQPGSACQPGVAVAPLRARRLGRVADDVGDGMDVQNRCSSANEEFPGAVIHVESALTVDIRTIFPAQFALDCMNNFSCQQICLCMLGIVGALVAGPRSISDESGPSGPHFPRGGSATVTGRRGAGVDPRRRIGDRRRRSDCVLW